MKSMPSDFCAQAPWQLGSRIEPPGPAEACHRAGQRPDPVGRPDDKLRDIRVTPSGMSLRSIRAPSRLHLGTATTVVTLTWCCTRLHLRAARIDRVRLSPRRAKTRRVVHDPGLDALDGGVGSLFGGATQ